MEVLLTLPALWAGSQTRAEQFTLHTGPHFYFLCLINSYFFLTTMSSSHKSVQVMPTVRTLLHGGLTKTDRTGPTDCILHTGPRTMVRIIAIFANSSQVRGGMNHNSRTRSYRRRLRTMVFTSFASVSRATSLFLVCIRRFWANKGLATRDYNHIVIRPQWSSTTFRWGEAIGRLYSCLLAKTLTKKRKQTECDNKTIQVPRMSHCVLVYGLYMPL